MINKFFVLSLIAMSIILSSCDDNPSNTDSEKSDILIGQVWMNKNLDVDHYRNGDKIPEVKDPIKWSQLTTGAWCYYNNDPVMGQIYGKLYNGFAIDDPRGLAPKGWHIPTDVEWTKLMTCVSDEMLAGGALKEKGTLHWEYPNKGATDEYGFSALPGGYRESSGNFLELGKFGYWWSSTEYKPFSTPFLYYRRIYNANTQVESAFMNFRTGFSVRCIKD